jgi:hypothetical protein
MPKFARVVFRRDENSQYQLLPPAVAPVMDGSENIPQPFATQKSVVVDIELEPSEALPDARDAVALRALERVKLLLPHFKLPVDDPGMH